MKNVSFYHKETGILHPKTVMVSDDGALEANTPADHIPIDNPKDGSAHDHLSKRFDLSTKEIVDWRPQQPSAEHEWDTSTRRWRLNAQMREREARRKEAHLRIASLITEERDLIRRLVLTPTDDDSRKSLAAIDAEMTHLLSEYTNP